MLPIKSICKRWNGESGNVMRGMMEMQGIRIGMWGIVVGMQEIRVGIQGIGVEIVVGMWNEYRI